MDIVLSSEEIDILVKLIQAELENINPEIRRSATSRFRIQLREDREVLRNLLDRLNDCKGRADKEVVGF